jgi:type IV secretion system protein VirB2
MGILNRMKTGLKREETVLALVAAVMFTAATTMPALAQELSPITNMLTKLGTALTGPVGKAVGLIAVIAVGFSAFTGRMNWMFAGSVLLGLTLVFGAATIMNGIGS